MPARKTPVGSESRSTKSVSSVASLPLVSASARERRSSSTDTFSKALALCTVSVSVFEVLVFNACSSIASFSVAASFSKCSAFSANAISARTPLVPSASLKRVSFSSNIISARSSAATSSASSSPEWIVRTRIVASNISHAETAISCSQSLTRPLSVSTAIALSFSRASSSPISTLAFCHLMSFSSARTRSASSTDCSLTRSFAILSESCLLPTSVTTSRPRPWVLSFALSLSASFPISTACLAACSAPPCRTASVFARSASTWVCSAAVRASAASMRPLSSDKCASMCRSVCLTASRPAASSLSIRSSKSRAVVVFTCSVRWTAVDEDDKFSRSLVFSRTSSASWTAACFFKSEASRALACSFKTTNPICASFKSLSSVTTFSSAFKSSSCWLCVCACCVAKRSSAPAACELNPELELSWPVGLVWRDGLPVRFVPDNCLRLSAWSSRAVPRIVSITACWHAAQSLAVLRKRSIMRESEP
mmetsp:Transcript_9218/g.23369  ORF Transcript_9218/g.23369 Transcript_9218/m.23369 type:complete len:481 (+) Transcript_9218:903-2345(+)